MKEGPLSMLRLAVLCALALLLHFAAPVRAAEDPENTLYVDLDYGRVVIRMRPDLAPNHVARMRHLVRGGFFDGLVFHRVIPGFVAQTGDPTGRGTGGSKRMLKAEFSRTPQVRGVVAMALGGGRNTGDSQWFIVLGDAHRRSLDGKYTVWGEVTSGMEFVDQIRTGDLEGRVTNPDRIVRMRVAADVDRPSPPSADLRAAPDAGATARNFSGGEFRCSAMADASSAASHAPYAYFWTHGFVAGSRKGRNVSPFAEADAGALDAALRELCATHTNAFLFTAVSQDLAKTDVALAPVTAVFPAAAFTCGDYTAGRGGDRTQADLIDLWVFAFIQGHKGVGQPGLEIPFAYRARILAALATACGKLPQAPLVDLAAAVAEKVTLK